MRIKIIATPPGGAPEWVREAWVGLELPVSQVEGGLQMGVRGGAPENPDGYTIWAPAALKTLKDAGRADAHNWWVYNAPYIEVGHLVFKQDVCEVITT